jgi:hypothetical protein
MQLRTPLLALYIMFANALDAYLTHIAVYEGEARELNPLMNYILDDSVEDFYFVKIGVVSLALILLLRMKEKTLSSKVLVIAAVIYTVVLAIHARGIIF